MSLWKNLTNHIKTNRRVIPVQIGPVLDLKNGLAAWKEEYPKVEPLVIGLQQHLDDNVEINGLAIEKGSLFTKFDEHNSYLLKKLTGPQTKIKKLMGPWPKSICFGHISVWGKELEALYYILEGMEIRELDPLKNTVELMRRGRSSVVTAFRKGGVGFNPPDDDATMVIELD